MKRKLICFISAVIILLSSFTVTASAEKLDEFNLECNLPKDFVVLTEKNAAKNEAALKSLGFSVSSFKNYLKNNNIVLFASLPDKSCQLTVNVNATQFSQQTEDFAYLNDEQIISLSALLSGVPEAEVQIVESNSNKFACFAVSGADKAGDFALKQFISVKNSELYTVNIAFSDNKITEENEKTAHKLLSCIDIQHKKTGLTVNSFQNTAIYVGIVVILLFLLAVIGYVVYTVITDITAARNTSDVAPYVKIKRRRFK